MAVVGHAVAVAVEEYAVVVAAVEASFLAAVASPVAVEAGEVVPSLTWPAAVAAVVVDGAEGAGTVVVTGR